MPYLALDCLVARIVVVCRGIERSRRYHLVVVHVVAAEDAVAGTHEYALGVERVDCRAARPVDGTSLHPADSVLVHLLDGGVVAAFHPVVLEACDPCLAAVRGAEDVGTPLVAPLAVFAVGSDIPELRAAVAFRGDDHLVRVFRIDGYAAVGCDIGVVFHVGVVGVVVFRCARVAVIDVVFRRYVGPGERRDVALQHRTAAEPVVYHAPALVPAHGMRARAVGERDGERAAVLRDYRALRHQAYLRATCGSAERVGNRERFPGLARVGRGEHVFERGFCRAPFAQESGVERAGTARRELHETEPGAVPGGIAPGGRGPGIHVAPGGTVVA